MVGSALDVRRGVLPHGGGVLGVVGDQDLEHGVNGQSAHDVEDHDGDGVIGVQGLRQGDAGADDLFGKGHSVGGAVRLAVIGHHLEGVGPVEDFLIVGGGDGLERVGLAQGGRIGPLEHVVQILLDRHGVPIRIGHLVGQGKALIFGAQVRAGGRVTGDDGIGVIVHRAGVAGDIGAGGVQRVIGPDTVGHRIPPGGDGVRKGQGGALVDLGPCAAVDAPLQLIAAEVVIAVRGTGPGDGQGGPAPDGGGHRDGAGGGGGPVVDHRDIAAGFPAGVKALCVIGLDPEHDGGGAKGHVVGGAPGAALVDLGPGGAAVGAPLHDIARKVALSVRGRSPAHGDVRAAVDAGGIADTGGGAGGGVDGHRAVIADIEGGGESESGAGPEGVGAAVVVEVAIGVQVPGVVGVVRVRGTGPLRICGAIQLCDFQQIEDRAGQRRALSVHVGVGLAQLRGGQQEHGPLQGGLAVVPVAGSVVDFGGAHRRADVGVQQVLVGAVEPGVNGAAGVGVDVGAVPLALVITVLADHQHPPGSVQPAFIVLLGNVKLHQHAVFLELDDGALCLAAKGDSCH